MSVKALKKQLMAAIAMVIVAGVALGSSTYAWFVTAGAVTATGMEVQAQASAGLIISYDGAKWGTSATAGMSPAQELQPTSTTNLANWFHASAEKFDLADALEGTREEVTGVVMSGASVIDDNDYVVMKEFKIKSASDTADVKGLYVKDIKVAVGDGKATKTMSTALRVGVKYVDSKHLNAADPGVDKMYIFGPVSLGGGAPNNPSSTYQVFTNIDSEGKAADAGTTVTLNKTGRDEDSDHTPFSSLVKGEATLPSGDEFVTVQIFVWFEGEDHNLNSANFNVEDLKVSVDFADYSVGAPE